MIRFLPRRWAPICLFTAVPLAHAQTLSWDLYNPGSDTVLQTLSGSSISFDVPAGSTYWVVTNNFVPLDLSVPSTYFPVTYTLSTTAGFDLGSGRAYGVGLFNSGGTAGDYSDDVGYWARFNLGGPYHELFTHDSGNANLFTGSQQGQGGTYTGTLANNEVYDGKIQLRTDGSGNIALGGGNSVPNAGISLVATGVTQIAYINPVSPLGGETTMDLFAFYFNNASATTATVSLGSLSLTPVAIPETSSLTWMSGLAALALLARRRRA